MSDRPREVVIAEYDAGWAGLFEAERDRMLAIAPDVVVSVEHIGSTSVVGLAAKPIIDMLVTVRRFFAHAEIAAICSPGHEYRGIDDDIQRQYFSQRTPPAYHLHCYLSGSPEAERMLLFRDYLRAHADVAKEYEALKRSLAATYRFDRVAYTDAKEDFVRQAEETARAWQKTGGSLGERGQVCGSES